MTLCQHFLSEYYELILRNLYGKLCYNIDYLKFGCYIIMKYILLGLIPIITYLIFYHLCKKIDLSKFIHTRKAIGLLLIICFILNSAIIILIRNASISRTIELIATSILSSYLMAIILYFVPFKNK